MLGHCLWCPPGVSVGPEIIYFVQYIDDICKVSSVLKFVLFADDTDIFCAQDNLNELLRIVIEEMRKIKKIKKNKIMV